MERREQTLTLMTTVRTVVAARVWGSLPASSSACARYLSAECPTRCDKWWPADGGRAPAVARRSLMIQPGTVHVAQQRGCCTGYAPCVECPNSPQQCREAVSEDSRSDAPAAAANHVNTRTAQRARMEGSAARQTGPRRRKISKKANTLVLIAKGRREAAIQHRNQMSRRWRRRKKSCQLNRVSKNRSSLW